MAKSSNGLYYQTCFLKCINHVEIGKSFLGKINPCLLNLSAELMKGISIISLKQIKIIKNLHIKTSSIINMPLNKFTKNSDYIPITSPINSQFQVKPQLKTGMVLFSFVKIPRLVLFQYCSMFIQHSLWAFCVDRRQSD